MNIWPKIFVIGYGDDAIIKALKVADTIRHFIFDKYQSLQIRPIPCIEVCRDGNVKKQIEKADKGHATHVVIMRNEETSAIKDMQTGEQHEMPSACVADEFCRLMEERYL